MQLQITNTLAKRGSEQLGFRAVWSGTLQGAFWLAKDTKLLHADNEDWSDYADAQNDLSLCKNYMSEGTFPERYSMA